MTQWFWHVVIVRNSIVLNYIQATNANDDDNYNDYGNDNDNDHDNNDYINTTTIIITTTTNDNNDNNNNRKLITIFSSFQQTCIVSIDQNIQMCSSYIVYSPKKIYTEQRYSHAL